MTEMKNDTGAGEPCGFAGAGREALRTALLTVISDAAGRLERLARARMMPAVRKAWLAGDADKARALLDLPSWDESDWTELGCFSLFGRGVLEAAEPLREADAGIEAAAERLKEALKTAYAFRSIADACSESEEERNEY